MVGPARVALYVGCALLGLVFGMIATLLHRGFLWAVPVGLIVALLACAALVCACGVITGTRLGAFLAAAGWVSVLVITSLGLPPTNDVVLITNPQAPGYSWVGPAWVYAGTLVAMTALLPPYPRLVGWATNYHQPRRAEQDTRPLG